MTEELDVRLEVLNGVGNVFGSVEFVSHQIVSVHVVVTSKQLVKLVHRTLFRRSHKLSEGFQTLYRLRRYLLMASRHEFPVLAYPRILNLTCVASDDRAEGL